MNSQLILVIVIGICAGISAACLIAASLLAKRNISGDSHADPRFFTDGIAITDRTENLGIHETDHLNYLNAHAPAKALYPTTPVNQSQVIRPEKL